MEAASSSKRLVPIYHTAWCHITKDHDVLVSILFCVWQLLYQNGWAHFLDFTSNVNEIDFQGFCFLVTAVLGFGMGSLIYPVCTTVTVVSIKFVNIPPS
jgi:hypothetical protein